MMKTSKILTRIFGYGLLLLVIWLAVLFLLSVIFRFETSPTPSAIITFAIIMGLIVRWLVSHLKVTSLKEGLLYGCTLTLIVTVAVLIITIANQTTAVIFGNPVIYLVFALMALAPLTLRYQH